MSLVTRPAQFDVLVMENMFGDILSDEASVLAGSLGMLSSASIGERRTAHGLHGLYEPGHGSAPHYAGRDVANPIGTILSGALLLRWSFGQAEAAAAIEAAVTTGHRRRLPHAGPLADRRRGRFGASAGRHVGPHRSDRGAGSCGGKRGVNPEPEEVRSR